jgi:hypothetical protein
VLPKFTDGGLATSSFREHLQLALSYCPSGALLNRTSAVLEDSVFKLLRLQKGYSPRYMFSFYLASRLVPVPKIQLQFEEQSK